MNHKNGVRTDNVPENLEYMTVLENIHHSIGVLGSHRRGEKNPAAVLTEEKVVEIRHVLAAGETCRGASRIYGISNVQLRRIETGKSWPLAGGPINTAPRKTGRPRMSA